MPVTITSDQDREPIEAHAALLARCGQAALAAEGMGGFEVSVTVVSDEALHALNRDYLGHDYPTDVVTFPLREDGDPDLLLGEVVISADRAREEATARGLPFEEELARYVVHGCLHLSGWDDRRPADKKAMHARQESILTAALAGTTRPAVAAKKAAPAQKKAPAPKKAAKPKPASAPRRKGATKKKKTS